MLFQKCKTFLQTEYAFLYVVSTATNPLLIRMANEMSEKPCFHCKQHTKKLSLFRSPFWAYTHNSMDFSRFNQAEQAQIAAMIEHKQVIDLSVPWWFATDLPGSWMCIDEGLFETLQQSRPTLLWRLRQRLYYQVHYRQGGNNTRIYNEFAWSCG